MNRVRELLDRLGLRVDQSADQPYEAAMNRVAGDLGTTPAALAARLNNATASLAPTASCITLTELEDWPRLPGERLSHAENCDFCRRLLAVIEPRPEEASQFSAQLIRAKPVSRTGTPAGPITSAVGGFKGGLLAGAAVAFGTTLIQKFFASGTTSAQDMVQMQIRAWYQREYERSLALPLSAALLVRRAELLIHLGKIDEASHTLREAEAEYGADAQSVESARELLDIVRGNVSAP